MILKKINITQLPADQLEELRKCAVFESRDGRLAFDARADCYLRLIAHPLAATIARQDRPRIPSARQLVTATMAIASGRKVPLNVMQERAGICERCDQLRIDRKGRLWCGVCGCGMSPANKEVLNLAAYEENLPHWGCKHPRRSAGRGWPLQQSGTGGGP
jgi:hypothetical protein